MQRKWNSPFQRKMVAATFLFSVAWVSAFAEQETTRSASEDASQPFVFEGYVKPSREAELTPLVSNAVVGIHFTAGQHVDEGDLLIEFGKKAPQIERRLAETALADARAQLRLIEAELDRKNELFLKELLSEAELQVTQAKRDIAVVNEERAKLNLEAAELVYSFTEIKAPFSGVMSEPRVKLYEYLSTERSRGQTLAHLVDIDPVFVIVKVPYEIFALRRELFKTDKAAFEGTKLNLTLADGQTYAHEGQYFAGAVEVDPTTQLMDVWAQFPNPDHLLRPGAKVKVTSVVAD